MRFPSMLLGCRNSCVLNDTRQNLKTILEYSAEDGFLKENVGVLSGASLTKYGSPGLNIVLSAILRAYTCCKPIAPRINIQLQIHNGVERIFFFFSIFTGL